MKNKKKSIEVIDTISVKTRKVFCSGENDIEGHPKIYLEINNGEDCVICPYCSKKFLLEDNFND